MSAQNESMELQDVVSKATEWDAEWLKFYQQWWPKVVALLVSISNGDTRFAEELAQESFLDHRKRWASLDDPDRAHAYLFRIALRRMGRRQAREARSHPFPSDTSGAYSASADIFEQADDRRRVYEAIQQLPPRQAEAVALFYLLDQPIRDIAEIQQISESTVRVHLTNARRALAELLGEDDALEEMSDEPR